MNVGFFFEWVCTVTSVSVRIWKRAKCAKNNMPKSGRLFLLRPCAFFSLFLVTRPRSFWLKTKKKKKKLRITKSELLTVGVMRTTLARYNLQTRLSGRRNFFTVIAMRKKNFLLICSWMEVDDRVNVSNQYSKSMMLAIHTHFPKLWKHLNALLRELGGSKRLTLSGHWKPKAKILSVEIIERRLCW